MNNAGGYKWPYITGKGFEKMAISMNITPFLWRKEKRFAQKLVISLKKD